MLFYVPPGAIGLQKYTYEFVSTHHIMRIIARTQNNNDIFYTSRFRLDLANRCRAHSHIVKKHEKSKKKKISISTFVVHYYTMYIRMKNNIIIVSLYNNVLFST